ncbi:hypothetical protein [Streptomyces sp. KS_5]|uniref:hypothetical protein n=1 Tax=Streptomyces sp. KS_5 TaxID=1881018 RepID=UPI00115FE624|nr:hypothetical protein [Streptomyces sp. KS_5]
MKLDNHLSTVCRRAGRTAQRIGGWRMESGREPAFHQRAESGPIRDYVAALRKAWAPAKGRGATQAQLARFGHFAESTVSKYFSGERIAPAEFVDALFAFEATVTDGAVAARAGETERVHTLRRRAENVGSAKTQLRAAREKIRRLEQRLEAAEAAHRTGADPRVRELQEQLARSTQEINELSRQLRAVQRELQAERDRGRKAALASSVASTALAVKGLDGIIRAARPLEEIVDEQEMTRELLAAVGQLEQRLGQLRSGQPGSTTTTWQEAAPPRLRERDTPLFRHPLPVRIYTTAATLSACAVLHVNVASFVVTWRDDAGLTIAQLVAYIILVFPLTLCLWGLLTASALFVAYGHRNDFGEAAAFITALAAVAALVLGISGPFFLPALTWVGHAWAVSIGIL